MLYCNKHYASLIPMQQVEDFMRDLFVTRITEEKQILANRASYRQKFFSCDCYWDSRTGTLKMIETEQILNIQRTDSEATVITEYKVPYYISDDRAYRHRYHLKLGSDNWLIWLVENECPACRGQGDESCIYCKGKHWTSGGSNRKGGAQ